MASDMSKTEAIEKLDRAKSSLARIRQKSKSTLLRLQRLGGAAVGGAISGALQTRAPFVPGTQMDSGQAVAAALTLAALTDVVGDEALNEFLLSVAGGVVAAEVCDATRDAMFNAQRVRPTQVVR